MALLGSQSHYQIRQPNKEPEWSSICNNVFDEYLDANKLFGLAPEHHERNSSSDSRNLFDFSGASEQSHETEATSISSHNWQLPSQYEVVPARQPQAKEPATFWEKTLRALEHNAAQSDKQSRSLRTAKSHPDFLSLGGHPSPPAIPSSPTDESAYAQQRLPRAAVQNSRRRNITARSLSRGRPAGVTKSTVAGSTNPHATPRKASVSPHKMMTPSRYRAGYQDVWQGAVEPYSAKYESTQPGSPLFCTPPPSANAFQQGFAAFQTNSNLPMSSTVPIDSAFDDHVSPLAATFQRTHIHTPAITPAKTYATYSDFPPANMCTQQSVDPFNTTRVPISDTAPLYGKRAPSLAASRIQSFDFGFPDSTSDGLWNTGISQSAATNVMLAGNTRSSMDPFGPLDAGVMPTTEPFDLSSVGLGITCDPSLVSHNPPQYSSRFIPPAAYQPAMNGPDSYHLPKRRSGVPSTPHRRARSCHRSVSPSPPATEPRSSKRNSSTRRPSRHRRAKSTNSTQRHSQNVSADAFMNFTAQDSDRILNGVAPSGSSKTKARREKEAADKRRRFSQAAVRAVVEAGGDLDALRCFE